MKKKYFAFGLCLAAVCSTPAYATTMQDVNNATEMPAATGESTGEESADCGVSIGTVEAQLYSESGLSLDYFGDAEYVAQTSEGTYMGFALMQDWVYDEETGVETEVEVLSLTAISSTEAAVTIPDAITVGEVTYPVTRIEGSYNFQYGFTSDIKRLTIPASVNHINNYRPFDRNLDAIYMLGGAPEDWSSSFSVPVVYVCDKSCLASFRDCNAFSNSAIRPYGWDYEWVTVEVVKNGEFAETYLEQNNYDWGAVQYLKVTGNINEIDLNAIKNLTSLIKLDLSETAITAIPDQFMYNCSLLTEVKLPSTVTSIGESAFSGCSALQTFDLPNITAISSSAFRGCSQLSYINLTGVKEIGYRAFYQCQNLNNIDLSSVEFLGEASFSGCSSLESVDLSSVIYNEEDNAYYSGSAFYNCTSLKSVTFGEGIRVIGNGWFYNTALESVVLPEGIKTLGSRAFANCGNLTQVDMPAGLTSIGSEAFAGCSSLSQVDMKKGVTTIESSAFNGCTSLTEVSIPATVTSIGESAFSNTGLTAMKCYAVVPPAATSSFVGSNMDMTRTYLYVPPFSKDFYRNTQYWSDFHLMRSIEDQVDYILVDRALEINLDEEYNDVVANNPEMVLTTYNIGYNTYEKQKGALTARGEGTLSAGQLTITAELAHDITYQKIPTLINYADKMRADNVTANLYLQNQGYSGRWHFISLPFDVKVSEIVPSDNTYWVIRRYDSAARAAGETTATWVNLTADDIMEAGKGYIISAVRQEENVTRGMYSDNIPCFTFTSGNSVTKNNLFRPTDIIVPLSEYSAEFAHNRSWNLIGNPYPCYFNMHYLNEEFTAPVTVWNGSTYEAYSPVDDDLVLAPFQAFFVQCPLNATEMTFQEAGRMHTATIPSADTDASRVRAALSAGGRDVFNFEVKGESLTDRARIVLNPEAKADYEIGRDASKFFAEKCEGAQIYVAADVNYSIAERPVGNGLATLGIRASKEESCTLSLSGRHSADWSVILTDKTAGKSVDLTRESYTFTCTPDDDANRFSVKFEQNAPADNINTVTSAFGQDAHVTVTTLGGTVVFTGRLQDVDVPAGIYIISNGSEARKAILK